jgi:hypothetical protein
MENEENSEEETQEEDTNQDGDKDLELDEESNEEEDGDPLNKMDRTTLLAEAKKLRAIGQRNKGKKDEHKEVKTPVDTSMFIKKSDLELANQKKAIRMATTEMETDSDVEKRVKTDLKENWNDVQKYYVSRRGKTSPEDIVDDIRDAYLIFLSRKPADKESKVNITELVQTAVMPGQVAPKEQKVLDKKPPGFKLPKQPTEWYPKKKE